MSFQMLIKRLAINISIPSLISRTTILRRYHSSGPNGTIRYKVIIPSEDNGSVPIIFLLRDMLEDGHFKTSLNALRELAHSTRCIIVLIDFNQPPVPDYEIDLSINYRALRWIVNNSVIFTGKVERIFIAGIGTAAYTARDLTRFARMYDVTERRGLASSYAADAEAQKNRNHGEQLRLYIGAYIDRGHVKSRTESVRHLASCREVYGIPPFKSLVQEFIDVVGTT